MYILIVVKIGEIDWNQALYNGVPSYILQENSDGSLSFSSQSAVYNEESQAWGYQYQYQYYVNYDDGALKAKDATRYLQENINQAGEDYIVDVEYGDIVSQRVITENDKKAIESALINGCGIELVWYAGGEDDDGDELENSDDKYGEKYLKYYQYDYPVNSCGTENLFWEGAHSTAVVGITEEGLIVISWGCRMLVKWDDLNQSQDFEINYKKITITEPETIQENDINGIPEETPGMLHW